MRIRPHLLLFALWLAASPALAYVVVLKNGEQLTTRNAPKVEGDQAILVMSNGTTTSMPSSEIDFAKTEELNKTNLGQATVVGLGTERPIEKKEPPKQRTVADLIAERRIGLAPPEQVEEELDESAATKLPRTSAGYVDLFKFERELYRQAEVTTEVLQYLQGQGLSGTSIYQGTRDGRALLEVSANSEAAVFKALREVSNALIQARERYPDKLQALELILMNDQQVRAGQFVITPERAVEIASGQIEPSTFFLRYVEY